MTNSVTKIILFIDECSTADEAIDIDEEDKEVCWLLLLAGAAKLDSSPIKIKKKSSWDQIINALFGKNLSKSL